MTVAVPRVQLHATETIDPPRWAMRELELMERIEAVAPEFVARYTRDDGSLIWRDVWPGMDGSDDPYEAFQYLALFYALGGSETVYHLARQMWDAITWQWTQYGQLDREFPRHYDWMHHGEASLFHYFFGLTKPDSLIDRQRAVRFAHFYDGADPLAPNYDPELHLIKAPMTGSNGPLHVATKEHWSTHRGVLTDYLAPFEDMESVDFALLKCDWRDDAVYDEVIAKMNERLNKGDVPLNLNATGQLTHAYLYTGDHAFEQWVIEYLATWKARADANDGILPDNVGLSGKVGEYLDGKWWGGHYGWRWPHGFHTIIEPSLNAAHNALLMTGDLDQLALPRQQIDVNYALGKEIDGIWQVPYKHFDAGWTAYRPMHPLYAIHLWTRSLADEDRERIERIPRTFDWAEITLPDRPFATKHFNANTIPWYEYIVGRNPGYPERMLDTNHALIDQQLRRLRSSEGDPRNWDQIHHIDGYLDTVDAQVDGYNIHLWQEFCPVYFESLVQLMWGAPTHITHGGLQYAAVRYFDADAERPGLPPGVAALVDGITADSVSVTLVNASDFVRRVVLQAGSFREHRFERAALLNESGSEISASEIDSEWFEVSLDPGAVARLRLDVTRFANDPSYETPWSKRSDWDPVIRGRDVA
ncbi:MAG TPA: hypothetical protein VFP05_13795 [Thermomicrobiales bacterium]|nr:hypothetical protein [Thermomicrobiales bacterium]